MMGLGHGCALVLRGDIFTLETRPQSWNDTARLLAISLECISQDRRKAQAGKVDVWDGGTILLCSKAVRWALNREKMKSGMEAFCTTRHHRLDAGVADVAYPFQLSIFFLTSDSSSGAL
jgi:hypothetical protein